MKKYLTVIVAFIFLLNSQLLNSQTELKLNEGDILAVKLPGNNEFNQFEIDFMGEILIHKIGKIKISGLTLKQAAQNITRHLPLYLRKISSVELYLMQKRKIVRVWGHIKSPGWKIVPYDATLEEILNIASGPNGGTLLNQILINRIENGKKKVLIADLSRFKKEGDINILPPIKNHDVITVLESKKAGDILGLWQPSIEREITIEQGVRIYGAVRKPGLFELKEDKVFFDILVSAGGFAKDANLKKVYIIRPVLAGVKKINMPIEDAIKESNFNNLPKIKPGDMIYVYTRHNIWKTFVGYFRDIAIITSSIILVSRFYK